MELKIAIILFAISIPFAFASAATNLSENNFPANEMQQITVTGTVTDESTGEAMPGVNVVVKGTSTGVLTDLSGKYSITIPGQTATVAFSFIGFNTLEIPYSGSSVMDAMLKATTQALDEVIVIGYGVQKKSDLTGSVVRVNMDNMSSLANTNISQALSGASAGVNVAASGLAGSEPSLSIRGQTSLSASDRPLIVLDGIIYNGAITDINISDVESVDILKDASSAAIYGSRSANGVMLITTKKGKSDKPVISFNAYYGYQDMTNNPMKVMNAEQYAVRLSDYNWQQNSFDISIGESIERFSRFSVTAILDAAGPSAQRWSFRVRVFVNRPCLLSFFASRSVSSGRYSSKAAGSSISSSPVGNICSILIISGG